MSKPTADRALARLLNLLPRLVRLGGRPVDEVCAELGLGRGELLADLERLSRLSWGDWDAGELFDFWVEDDRLHVHTGGLFERPVRLNPQEMLALRLGAERLRAAGLDDWSDELEPALAEIARQLGPEAAEGTEPLRRLLQVQRGDDSDPDHVKRVIDAAAGHRRLTIGYWSRHSDRHRTRKVDPLAVSQQRGVWYLSAFDHLSGERRVFRLDRLTALEETDERFDPPAGPRWSSDWSWGRGRAEVRLKGWLAGWARDEGWSTVEPGADGAVWRPAFDEPEGLARALVPLLGQIEVVGPPELKRALAQRIRETLERL